MGSSIKFKLVGSFLLFFLIVLTVFGIFLYNKLDAIVMDSIDSHLHSEVQLIAGLIRVDDGEFEVELSEAEVGDYAVALSGHYYQVVSSTGKIIGRSPSLSNVEAALPVVVNASSPTYKTIIGPRKLPLRLLSESFTFPESGTITVQASESLESSYELLALFKDTISILFPVVFFLSGLGMVLVTRYSFRPINIFSKKVGTITERNLNDRISCGDTASELRPLAENFNTMLARIEESFMRQKQFFSDASHELRTPTAVIKSTCDVTLSKERTTEEYREAIEAIEGASGRLAELIDRVLELSRLESKASALTLEEVDLKELIDKTLKLLAPTAKKREIKISIGGSSPTVRVDRDRITEAFTNIIDNAIKYSARGGSVVVEVGEEYDCASVTVIDDGMGIAKDNLERIFERFYRVDASRKGVEGSGLGLSIVKVIVEAHKGKIDIQSEVGKGTSFKVVLPKK
ncbi:MAG: sensor histidine kinase N-terminal domain-containing protein [Deltaproteobacteria bacterium]|nr:sensor histidine kinase N-terminal domain-containing protein [Deltaproteobacteria bacterium]